MSEQISPAAAVPRAAWLVWFRSGCEAFGRTVWYPKKRCRVPSQRTSRRRNFRRNSSGQSLVEFALVLPMLLLLFFGIFEFGRFYFTKLTLQHAVREATRFAVTGNVLIDPQSGDPMDRSGSITEVILENTKDLEVDLDGISISPADGGGPGDIVRVAIDFRYDLSLPLISKFVPGGHVDLSFTTAMRNESFYE